MNSQPDKLLVLIRPSLINYMKKVSAPASSHFIYSLWKGYQEDEGMARLICFARQKQMDVREIHTSGHASLWSLKKLVDTLKPEVVIPIHTFHPEKYDYLGTALRPLQDGEANNL